MILYFFGNDTIKNILNPRVKKTSFNKKPFYFY
jgi:hypothetical protein